MSEQNPNLIRADDPRLQVLIGPSSATEQEQGPQMHGTWAINPGFTDWLKTLPPGGKFTIEDK